LCNNRPSQQDIETFLITDEQNGHYIWMNLGWPHGDRITGMTVYVRIRDRKLWIEEDWTEDGIATDFWCVQGFPRKILCWHFTSRECGNTQILQPLRSGHLT